uniref:Uncharacterized protein n=1 Tax=Lactuca sativa TaxID=4236 RepID=A0A9R1VGU8_LACSA|nr:hypothetical protein LSAT_V11C500247220 [Lactuca sativa]
MPLMEVVEGMKAELVALKTEVEKMLFEWTEGIILTSCWNGMKVLYTTPNPRYVPPQCHFDNPFKNCLYPLLPIGAFLGTGLATAGGGGGGGWAVGDGGGGG